MFSTVRSPQFSGYWCVWGNPKKALEVYEEIKAVPNADFLTQYEVETHGVYGFVMGDLFADRKVEKLVEPYKKQGVTIEHVVTEKEAEWVKKHWSDYLAQLRTLSLGIKNSTQLFKLN